MKIPIKEVEQLGGGRRCGRTTIFRTTIFKTVLGNKRREERRIKREKRRGREEEGTKRDLVLSGDTDR
eukprot:scaffold216075_cov22-Tisochrysis_lutea.AAC.1